MKRTVIQRKDGKYLVYLPKDLVKDSVFPFWGRDTVFAKASFSLGDRRLTVENGQQAPRSYSLGKKLK
jgi:hypothetical protein